MPHATPRPHDRERGGARPLLVVAVALLALAGLAGAVLGALWLVARDEAVHYDEDGVPTRAWHRLARRTPDVNVLLIAADTLRADAVGAYGATPSPTPRIDALASDGVVFEEAMTAAIWTLPSFASIFTGLYPPAHGVLDKDEGLGDEHVTLAELLRGAGYATAGFTAGGFLTRRYGLDQGFADYAYDNESRLLDESVDGALEWLADQDAGRPWFLFVHGFDPHRPYRPDPLPSPPPGYEPPPLSLAEEIAARLADGETFESFPLGLLRLAVQTADLGKVAQFDDAFWDWVDGRFPTRESFHLEWRRQPGADAEIAWLRALYGAQLARMDGAVAHLLDAVSKREDGARTLVVFLSDHGEELMDHAMIGHTRANRAVARVPLIVRPPAGFPFAPGRVPDVVRTIDLLPTVLEVVGLAPPRPLEGRSLVPLLRGATLPAVAAATFGTRHPEDSIRLHGWRLIRRATVPDDPVPATRLFEVDPAGAEPLVHAEDHALVERLDALLHGVARASAALSHSAAETLVGVDEDLRALGYLGGGE